MTMNTVSSLAILTSNWQVNKKDYIENFIPFIATLIKKQNYKHIDVNTLCKDFGKEFGLSIPFHPMKTILIRAKKRGLIRKEHGGFVPVRDKITEYEFSSSAKEQLRKQEKVITEIISFAKQKYQQVITKEIAEAAFISFLKTHDLDILFAAEEETLLPKVSASKKDKFIVYSFIRHAYESEPETFKFIVDAAIGHLMANSLLYREFSRFVGKLRGICFYIDTRFIFRLLGLEGEQRETVYSEFLKTLTREGASLYVFRHTYEETMEILEHCTSWVENPAYDPSRATPVLQFFVEHSYTKLDVMRFINKVDAVLEEHGIHKKNIVEPPDKTRDTIYQIDESQLQDLIIETYKRFDPFFDEMNKELTLKRDIDSIAAIYKLRKGANPRRLKDAGHVFMTTNGGLAYAARKYEILRSENPFNIPACVTDTFVGTILWLQSPAKILEINERKIIAECYAALRPDSRLIKKYLAEVEKFKNEKKIDENTYYMLRCDSVTLDLLEEKTLGDPDNFNSTVLSEILDEIRAGLSKEERVKLIKEKKEHIKTVQKLQTVIEQSSYVKNTIELRAEQIAKLVSNTIGFIILGLFIAGLITQLFPAVMGNSVGKFMLVSFLILGAINVIYGFNMMGLKNRLKQEIKLRIINYFTKH